MALHSKVKGMRQRLKFDNLIGSQPELGPAPPDGGYGWVILFGVMMIQVSVIISLELKVPLSANVKLSYSKV
jgi:hypothetical protein